MTAPCRCLLLLHVCDKKQWKVDLLFLQQTVRAAWSYREAQSDFTTAAAQCLAQTVRADSSVHSQDKHKAIEEVLFHTAATR